MKRTFIALTAMTMMAALPVQAKPINAETLIGKYTAAGRVLLIRFAFHLEVLPNNEFLVSEMDKNGNLGEVCNGKFSISGSGLFSGSGTCPSNRSDEIKFNMNLGNAQIEDLERGSKVNVKTSKTGNLTVTATVKKYL